MSYGLLERYGVELEYMIVDRRTLDIRPIADKILGIFGDPEADEHVNGPITWCNELVSHVIELKTTEPAVHPWNHVLDFQKNICEINTLLEPHNAMLLPTGMHPWMDPTHETHLWPYGNKDIYRAFDGIFNCKGHGWSNLQSAHLNLSFNTDEEFFRLHAAVRLVLPLIAALTASSPIMEGRITGKLDTRLDVYRTNCKRIPQVTARVVPEPVTSPDEYQKQILQPIYDALPPTTPPDILKEEWTNARGAIARFQRNTIEIRVIDTQECPQVDLAILSFIAAIIRWLIEENTADVYAQNSVNTLPLADLFVDTLNRGFDAETDNAPYLDTLGLSTKITTVGEILRALYYNVSARQPWAEYIQYILENGCLSQRVLNALDGHTDHAALLDTYARLAQCLQRAEVF